MLIVVRGGWAGEIVDFIDFDVERKRHVVTHEFKPLVVEKRRDVVARACEEIVDAQYILAIGEQAFAQIGTEEAGPASDKYSLSVDQSQPHNRLVRWNPPAHPSEHAAIPSRRVAKFPHTGFAGLVFPK
jgi:hypothetical protein